MSTQTDAVEAAPRSMIREIRYWFWRQFQRKQESALVSYARSELQRAGLYDNDSDYGGMLGPAILDVVKAFSKAGHSGFSASMAASALEKLLRFEPLMPLTGEDDEWGPVLEGDLRQNKRCSRVFQRLDGTAFDIEGKVFHDETGCYTNRESSVDVAFPYVPTTEIIDVAKGDDE